MQLPVSRRSLIAFGLTVGAAGLGWRFAQLPPPALGLKVLSTPELETCEAIARVFFPPGHFPVGGGDGGTAPMVDEVLAVAFPPDAIQPFRLLLRSLEVGTLVSRGQFFRNLPLDEQKEVMAVWSSEEPFPRRLITDSFRVVIAMAFLRRPEVLAHLGWRTGCSDVFVVPAEFAGIDLSGAMAPISETPEEGAAP